MRGSSDMIMAVTTAITITRSRRVMSHLLVELTVVVVACPCVVQEKAQQILWQDAVKSAYGEKVLDNPKVREAREASPRSK